jgi:hypothetical protein
MRCHIGTSSPPPSSVGQSYCDDPPTRGLPPSTFHVFAESVKPAVPPGELSGQSGAPPLTLPTGHISGAPTTGQLAGLAVSHSVGVPPW